MACTSMATSASPATMNTNVHKEYKGLRRSDSIKDLHNQAAMLRRSVSDNHLCSSVNSIRAAAMQPKLKSSQSFGIFPFQISSSLIPNSIRSFLFDPETSKDMDLAERNVDTIETMVESDEETEVTRANWVARLLQIRSHWKNRQQLEDRDGDQLCDYEEKNECEDGCIVDDDLEKKGGDIKYDHQTFSRFLAHVPWSDIKLFSKLSFLCNMAYIIPEIKAKDLRRHCGLQFVTSSLEKKAEAAAVKAKLDQDSTDLLNTSFTKLTTEKTYDSEQRHALRSSVYEIAASAASYVQSQAKGHSSCGYKLEEDSSCTASNRSEGQAVEEGGSSPRVYKSEVAAVVAASTMTAVVAAGEKEKQKAATALQSLHSSPCEWFICDDLSTYTRCFVIQGSDSLASWQANLFFEPAKFEGTEVLVHRGIYEAAKGIYEQFMPEIVEHLIKHGERAKLQFTGHSLGGCLSLLVDLMLLTRKVVKPSVLRPVVTFGSPFVFCGGQKLLGELGLDESHIQCVMMHRDIVPRAFSCNYPNHVAQVLKRLNGPLRLHPCLLKNKLLYSPLGKIFILQPDEKSSPSHPFLPPGSALYSLDKTQCGYSTSALHAFLNCPHPLETLSDPTAYGSEGTILRDHDSSNYLKAINKVLKQTSKAVVPKVKDERYVLWPLLASPPPHSWNHEPNLESNTLVTKEVMTV